MNDELISLRARFAPGWPDEIRCGPGWNKLLAELDVALAAIDPEYRVYQVKEKFGGLRFYVADGPARSTEFENLVNEAEAASFRTCEECGGAGATGRAGYGWVRTLCADCAPEGWEAFTDED
jgi:hypothetical protein